MIDKPLQNMIDDALVELSQLDDPVHAEQLIAQYMESAFQHGADVGYHDGYHDGHVEGQMEAGNRRPGFGY